MINLLTKINISNENDYLEAISSSKNNGQKIIFFYLNSHVLYEARTTPELEKIICSCDYLIADGYSIVWIAKKLLEKEIQKIVFTYSYFKFIRNYFIQNNIPIFFLGSTQNNIEKAVQMEKDNFPNLKIAGYHHGYFDKKLESNKIINAINKSKATALVVGMGCSIAEKWIVESKGKLNPNLIFSVGGFFDFLAKDKIIAPKWMYNSGFEWVFRFLQEPRRLYKRYLFANTYILFYVMKNILFKKKN